MLSKFNKFFNWLNSSSDKIFRKHPDNPLIRLIPVQTKIRIRTFEIRLKNYPKRLVFYPIL